MLNSKISLFYFFLNIALIGQTYYGAASFTNLGMGARGIAMGTAYEALVKDATAIYWNPAGIVHLNGFQGQITDIQNTLFRMGDVNYPQASISFSPEKRFLTYFNWGLGLGSSAFLVKNIDHYNTNSDYLGSFNAGETISYFAIGVSAYNISIGLNYKYIEQTIAGFTQNSKQAMRFQGHDFGIQFEPLKYLSIGIIVRDSIRVGRYDLYPQNTSFSIALKFKHFNLVTSYNNNSYKIPATAGGLELHDLFINRLFLRIGIAEYNATQYHEENKYLLSNSKFSLGAGYIIMFKNNRSHGIGIDFAYQQGFYPQISNPFSRYVISSISFF